MPINFAWSERLKDFDGFAKTIQFTFRGQTHFSTKVGGTIYLICCILFFFLWMVKTLDLITKKDQELKMIESESNYAGLDLFELGFMFAIEKIDPRLGKVEAEATVWEAGMKLGTVEDPEQKQSFGNRKGTHHNMSNLM